MACYSSRGNVGIGIEGSVRTVQAGRGRAGNVVVSTPASQWEWDTNAYYNPTNYDDDDLHGSGGARQRVSIITACRCRPTRSAITVHLFRRTTFRPIRFRDPADLCEPAIGYPDPVNSPASIDYYVIQRMVIAHSDRAAAIGPLRTFRAPALTIAVGNTTTSTVNYNLIIEIVMTNDVGNYYPVLEGHERQPGRLLPV